MTTAITDIASPASRDATARKRAEGATSFGVEQSVMQTSSGAPERRAGVDEVTFDAVLSLATTLLEVGPSGLGGQASPSQMFEANTDGDNRSRSAKQQSSSPAMERLNESRYDRTSISARQASGSTKTDGPAGNSISVQGSHAADRDIVAGSSSRSDDLRTKPMQRFQGAQGLPSEATNRSSSASRGSEVSNAPPMQGVAGQTDSVQSPLPASRIAVTPSEPNGKTGAQRVAQLLAVGRTSGAESARSVAAPGASVGADKAGTEQKQEVRGSNEPKRPSSSSMNSSNKTDSMNRSVFDELVRSIRLRSGVGESSARIQLNPPELGRLDVDVKLVDERIEIVIRTESQAARHLVQSRGMALTHALEQQGIVVERFDVATDSHMSDFVDAQGEQGLGTSAQDDQREPSQTADSSMSAVRVDGEIESVLEDNGPMLDVVAETRLDVSV